MKKLTKKTTKPTKEVADIVRTSIELIAIALEDIALSLKVKSSFNELNDAIIEHNEKVETIHIPSKTAKEIVEECDNKVAGGKLLYSTSWYENEDFYTKEKCRPRTVKIPTEIL